MRRTQPLAVSLFLIVAAAGRAFPDGDERIFFRDPDEDTRRRIKDAVSHMTTNSVDDRKNARRELESIGYWSVEPLVDALSRSDSTTPVRCSSILVLDALRDRRALEPMRAAVVRETANLYVAGFAALSLGRFHDAGAVESLRAALKTSKATDMLKAASAFAFAKLRTPEAKALLLERLGEKAAKEPAKSAALLSLGFFPDLALGAAGSTPTPELAAGLASKRRGERQAALLGYLVAAWSRGESKPFLREFFAGEGAPEVAMVALIGLARGTDADVTQFLAKTAERQGYDHVRELAGDLLFDRVDDAAKATVVQVARNNTASARLRTACVLALGRLDDDDARKVLADALNDHAPLVRAAGAVAFTRQTTAAGREAGLAAVKARLKRGETNDDVRADFEKALALLAGERSDARWTEVGPEKLFADMATTYSKRLLRAVNDRLMASLDLAKILNLQTDTEATGQGPPAMSSDSSGSDPGSGSTDDSTGGDSSGGSGSSGSGGGGTGGSSGGSGSSDGGGASPPGGGVGGNGPGGDGDKTNGLRGSQYQELRDLKIELFKNPYFGMEDLPAPPTTPGK